MDTDLDAPSRYTVRGAGSRHAAVRDPQRGGARVHAPSRAIDRMLVALRAYEQRAHARARLQLWLTARRAATDAGRA
jgi:hypothetical protein